MTDYTLAMNIDEEGILLIRMTGVFDFDAWKQKRQVTLDTDLAGVALLGRPSILDVSQCDPPISGWGTVFPNIQDELVKVGEGTGPMAFVTGTSPARMATVRFFCEVVDIMGGTKVDIEMFNTLADAYQWLIENDHWRNNMTE